jgi:hypothetical protein
MIRHMCVGILWRLKLGLRPIKWLADYPKTGRFVTDTAQF